MIDAGAAVTAERPVGVTSAEEGTRWLRVHNKVDQGEAAGDPRAVAISAATGQGIEALERACAELLGFELPSGDEGLRGGPGAPSAPQISAALGAAQAGWGLGPRHLAALEAASLRASAALEALQGGIPLDLVAEDLKHATDCLDEIAGRTVPEDLLDRIFAQFCLGK